MALPEESKVFLVVLLDRDEEEGVFRSLATYKIPGDVLSCSNNETTFGTVADIVANTWLSL